MPGYLRILAYLIIRQKPGFALHYFDSLYFSIYEYCIQAYSKAHEETSSWAFSNSPARSAANFKHYSLFIIHYSLLLSPNH